MAIEWEKLGIGVAVIAVGYVVWRIALPYIFSGLGRAMGAHLVVPLPSADLREDPRQLAAAAAAAASRPAGVVAPVVAVAPVAGTGPGFDRQAVAAVGGDWEAAARLNAVLTGLAGLRQPRVAREGALRGRVAWKVAVFRQAALYRVVDLATGSAANWNARNVLGAAAQARGLLEAAALLADFDRRLTQLSGAGDLAGIDALVTQRGFANPIDGPAEAASFDPALLDGAARAEHAALSGLVDAAALGQYRGFGELDKAGTAVTFSAGSGFELGVFGHVLGGFAALAAAEAALQAIEEKLPAVAALEVA